MVPGPFVINFRFQNIDEFAQTTREWNLDIKQLCRGRFEADLTQLGMRNVLVAHARFSLASQLSQILRGAAVGDNQYAKLEVVLKSLSSVASRM